MPYSPRRKDVKVKATKIELKQCTCKGRHDSLGKASYRRDEKEEKK